MKLTRKNGKGNRPMLLLENPGSALIQEAHFYLREGANLEDDKELSGEAERILREYACRGALTLSKPQKKKTADKSGLLFFLSGLFCGGAFFALALFTASQFL